MGRKALIPPRRASHPLALEIIATDEGAQAFPFPREQA